MNLKSITWISNSDVVIFISFKRRSSVIQSSLTIENDKGEGSKYVKMRACNSIISKNTRNLL